MHLNYSKDEFLDSTHAEIYKMWNAHIKFNGWEMKNHNDDENNTISDNNTDVKYKKMNIEDVPFL